MKVVNCGGEGFSTLLGKKKKSCLRNLRLPKIIHQEQTSDCSRNAILQCAGFIALHSILLCHLVWSVDQPFRPCKRKGSLPQVVTKALKKGSLNCWDIQILKQQEIRVSVKKEKKKRNWRLLRNSWEGNGETLESFLLVFPKLHQVKSSQNELQSTVFIHCIHGKNPWKYKCNPSCCFSLWIGF